jgi:hypothetical protein
LRWAAGSAVMGFALVWLYAAAFPMAFLSLDYVSSRVQQQRLANCELGDVAVFGDSRVVAAIVPDLMSVRVSNFGLQATTPVETWFAVQQAMRCPVPPRWVIIGHGVHAHNEIVKLWGFDAPYEFLNLAQRQEVRRVAAELNDVASLEAIPDAGVPAGLLDRAFAARFPPLYFASLWEARIGLRWLQNQQWASTLTEARGHSLFANANGSSEVAVEAEMQDFKPFPLMDHYFSKTLKLLDQHGVNVLYLSPPVNQSTYNHVKPDLAPEFLSYLRGKAETLDHFHVAEDVMACWPNAYFGDGGHLNEAGARKYSSELNELLTRLMADGGIGKLPDRCQRHVVAAGTAY